MQRFFATSLFSALLLFPDGARAADPSPSESVNEQKVPISARPGSDLWSYFSAGILINAFPAHLVESAEIRSGIVRIQEEQRIGVGLGLQAFYPLYDLTYLRSPDLLPLEDKSKIWRKYSQYGVGPYIGVSLTSTDIIDTVALGVAFSVQRREGGVRLGLGCVVDPNAKYLSPEFRAGDSAPTGAEGISYVTKAAVGLQVMMTFTPGFD
jgi:hypothetical protein